MSIIVHPLTGEVLDLDEPTECLAAWLQQTREGEEQLRAEKQRVQEEIIRRLDFEGKCSATIGEFEIKADGPAPPTEYDARALRDALAEYVEAEAISQDALDRAVEVIPEYKARKNGLNALRKLNSEIASLIDEHSHERENYQRRVSIKPRAL